VEASRGDAEVPTVEAQAKESAKEFVPPEQAASETESTHASFASVPEGSVAPVSESAKASAQDEVSAALNTLVPASSEGAAESTTKPDDDETQEYEIGAQAQEKEVRSTGPRWTANEVSVTEEESALVLELEMQRSYAAFAAADAARSACQAPQSVFKEAETHEALEATMSGANEMSGAGQVSTAIHPANLNDSEMATVKQAPMDESGSPSGEAHPTFAAAEKEEKAAYAVAAAGATMSAAPGLAEVDASGVSETAVPAETPLQPNPELATAWEQWKQVRNSLIHCENSTEFEKTVTEAVRQSEPALHTLQTDPGEDSAPEASEIANIVDSVLADLKPRLMEEISRKMGKGKKK
jgi:hypothetical protein